MREPTYSLDDIYVLRSDQGDGGWSIHVHGSEDEDGIPPTVASGEASLATDGGWSRPTQTDLENAVDMLNECGLVSAPFELPAAEIGQHR